MKKIDVKKYKIDGLEVKIRENKVNEAFGKHFEWNNKEFFLIFGKHINGGFSALPNKKVSCELSFYDDKFYNTERLSNVVRGKNNVKMLVDLIADYKDWGFTPINLKEFSIDYFGYNFLVIFGEYSDIPFGIITNWEVSFMLKDFGNIDENTEIIKKVLKNKKTAYAIASVIANAS